MRKNPKSILRFLAMALMTTFTILSLVQCPSGGSKSSPPPDFIGTWKTTDPASTFILMLAETTFTISIDTSNGSEFVTGGIDFDTSLRHILAMVATESYTGIPATTPLVVGPGENLYIAYLFINSTEMEMNWTKTDYPVLGSINDLYLFKQ